MDFWRGWKNMENKLSIKIFNLFVWIFLCAFYCFLPANAQDSIFNHKITPQQAAKFLPAFNSTSCKFSQTKILVNKGSTNVTLKSGGDFQFIKDKGVIFETKYPIESVSSYTSSQNKYVSSIINAISNKNYTFLEKNFDLYYIKPSEQWELVLVPKPASSAAQHLKMIYLKGNKHISFLAIETVNSKTSINFSGCK